MKSETFIIENRKKSNIRLENPLIFDSNYDNTSPSHDKFLELIEDNNFIEYCKNSDTNNLIKYLAEKRIINIKSYNNSEINSEIETNVGIPAVAVLVLVEAVAVIAATIIATVKEKPNSSNNYNLCTSDFNYCMKIIEKYATKQFCEDMFRFFSSIETGEPYTLKYFTKN